MIWFDKITDHAHPYTRQVADGDFIEFLIFITSTT
jgi:hypothetical protein